jgi:uncharacterized membrane protein
LSAPKISGSNEKFEVNADEYAHRRIEEQDGDSYKITLEKKPPDGISRVILMDEIRGFLVLAMVLYHILTVGTLAFGFLWAADIRRYVDFLQPVGAALFLVISGVASRLAGAEKTKKAAYKTGVFALGISLVSLVILPNVGIKELPVWFGILHVIAVSKWVRSWEITNTLIENFPAMAGAVLSLCLAIFFADLEKGHMLGFLGIFSVKIPDPLYAENFLMPLGFHNNAFLSVDYFPILPNIFFFFFGTAIGKYFIKPDLMPDFLYNKHSDLLHWFGRHALPIYILHVPIIYGLMLWGKQIFP